ncbi:MAG: DUF1385 domain-containing protein [Clostridiales Family XIII bacterium]|jgi:uncharacterized protein YqhQ|nr:DUF1385 domain-containing protein [Clostridiales Family XIII bacterium]
MDFKKIFIKGACPTKIGGQSVLEGIMMKGEDRTAVVVRGNKDRLYIKTEKLPERHKAAGIPIVRGVYIFVTTLMTGMQTLIYSAEVLEKFFEEDGEGVAGGGEAKAEGGAEADAGGIPFGVMIALSVALAIAFVVGIFIIVPTIVVNFLGTYTDNAIVLNVFEGVLRIVLFVIYIAVISRMKDIQTTFEYHGAEHKTIHCFESGLPLTPANAARFETLHPRCGTSFLMFVMIIALLLFSLMGWPNLAVRIASRIVFIPLIAGLSYELLRYAGQNDSALVKILSVPGLLLQQLTTRNPGEPQLEVAIAALKAVLVPKETPVIEGFCGSDGRLLPEEESLEFQSALEGF